MIEKSKYMFSHVNLEQKFQINITVLYVTFPYSPVVSPN